MRRPRYAKQIDGHDANHAEICDGLRKHGYEVITTYRPLDALVFDGSWSGWLEIKTTARDAKIQRSQIEFIAQTKMPVMIVKTLDEALRFITNRTGYTPLDKDLFASWLYLNPKVGSLHPAAFERILKS